MHLASSILERTFWLGDKLANETIQVYSHPKDGKFLNGELIASSRIFRVIDIINVISDAADKLLLAE
jgi:hypothetical protein